MKITTIDETADLIERYNVLYKVGKISESDKRYSILGALYDLYEQGKRDNAIEADTVSSAGNSTTRGQ